MLNNRNKQSQGLWVKRLFNLPVAMTGMTKERVYFAHLYRDCHILSKPAPFKTLFTEVSQWLPNNLSDATTHPPELGNKDDVSAVSFSKCDPYKSAEANLNENNSFLENTNTSSLEVTVLNCFNETPDTKTFRLGNCDKQAFAYLPGQYITLSLVIAGTSYKRSYSLASSPSRKGVYEITVKRAANGGLVSNWINDHLKVGDKLHIKGPFGNFSCAKAVPLKILFVAAGSGIVPIMSMLRWLTDIEANVDVIVLLSFRTVQNIIYNDELKLIAARHDNIRVLITLTKPSKYQPYGFGLIGRIDESMITACVPDLAERMVYLCGPDAFMMSCKNYFSNLKLVADKLACESFNVVSPIATGTHSTNGNVSRITGNYQVKFAKSGKIVNADGGKTILELAEQANIHIDYECRSGQCGECMVKCLQGNVEMISDVEIDQFNRKKGWVYSCCAYPASNAVLDA